MKKAVRNRHHHAHKVALPAHKSTARPAAWPGRLRPATQCLRETLAAMPDQIAGLGVTQTCQQAADGVEQSGRAFASISGIAVQPAIQETV